MELDSTRSGRAERLKIALYLGQFSVITKLIEEDPTLPADNLGLQIAMYDYDAVRTAIDEDSDAAVRKIGVRTPILHLAYSKYIHCAPELQPDMLRIAELLVEHGADVNDSYPFEPESPHCISALYGALGHADNMVLAEWLLKQGANPDDNESLYHSTELGHCDGLKLLMRFGVETKGTNALLRALDFKNVDSVRLLLEYGADPNEITHEHPSGQPIDVIPAFHQGARRWCPFAIAELLHEHDADPKFRWQGLTPFAVAAIYGNMDFKRFLENNGYATELSPIERKFADCADGKMPQGSIDSHGLCEELRLILTRIVLEPDRLDHLKKLVELGLDPNQPEEMGMTPLHLAGWAGLPEQVKYLLTLSPDLSYRNDYGGDALGTIVHGAEHRLDSADRDHISCARLVLEAGADLQQNLIDDTGCQKMADFLADWKNGKFQ